MIEQYKNKHLGEIAYIIASGSSVLNFKPVEEGVYIGVNTSFFNKDIVDLLSYIIIEYSPHVPKGMFKKLADNNTKVFTTFHDPDTIHLSLDDISEMNISTYNGTSSITFYCFMFALYCGFSKIYLVGCDCSTGKPHNIPGNGSYHSLVRGWKYIKEHIVPDNVKVITLNPVNLNIFKSITQ